LLSDSNLLVSRHRLVSKVVVRQLTLSEIQNLKIDPDTSHHDHHDSFSPFFVVSASKQEDVILALGHNFFLAPRF
jgi:hypothetical protein